MASLGNDANGCRRILFYDAEGARKTIRLGKVAKRFAESITLRVEALSSSAITGEPLDRDWSLWVANLEPWLREKLGRAALPEPIEPVAPNRARRRSRWTLS